MSEYLKQSKATLLGMVKVCKGFEEVLEALCFVAANLLSYLIITLELKDVKAKWVVSAP